MRELYKLFSKVSKFKYPNGVFKFRTFEEAEEHKMKSIIEAAKKNPFVFIYGSWKTSK